MIEIWKKNEAGLAKIRGTGSQNKARSGLVVSVEVLILDSGHDAKRHDRLAARF